MPHAFCCVYITYNMYSSLSCRYVDFSLARLVFGSVYCFALEVWLDDSKRNCEIESISREFEIVSRGREGERKWAKWYLFLEQIDQIDQILIHFLACVCVFTDIQTPNCSHFW